MLSVAAVGARARRPSVAAPAPPPSGSSLTIDATGVLYAQMRAAEPTTVISDQDLVSAASWNTVDYDEAILIAPTIPGALSGKTIVSAALTITRVDGYADAQIECFLKQILRTDVNAAQVCWDNRATGSAWQAGGAQGASDAGSSLTSTLLADAEGAVTFPTSSAFVAWLQGRVDGSITGPWLLMHVAPSAGSYHTFDGTSIQVAVTYTP